MNASPTSTAADTLHLSGKCSSGEQMDGLRRVVRILHAVIVGKDQGGSTLKKWFDLRRKPLEMALRLEPERYPELQHLAAFTSQSGATIHCEKIVDELTVLWRNAGRSADCERVRLWIKSFHPIAVAFPSHEQIEKVFEQARKVLAEP
jgi:hypothetical protein